MSKPKNNERRCTADSCRTEDREASIAERTVTPRVDIFEADDKLVLECDLPGVAPDGLEVRFENQELEIRGRLKPSDEKREFLRREHETGGFYRAFTLGDSIDSDGITAELSNGVLTLQLPKHQATRPRRILVQAT